MKAAAFDLARPTNLAEAVALLVRPGASALAGGQSLGPMLNFRLARPTLLVPITHLAALREATETATSVTIGACVTHAAIADGLTPDIGQTLLARVAEGIAYRAIRTRGTIGGSLCHADPAADWISTLVALSAACEICDGQGKLYRVPVEKFVTAAFENVLSLGEILQAVFIPRMAVDTRFAHHKISRKFGKFAVASGTVFYNPERQILKAVIGATHGRPIVIDDASELFGGKPSAGLLRFDEQSALGLLKANGIQSGPACQTYITALRRAAAEVFDS